MADLLASVPALVIGGLGFIGSNLTARLAARGARVTVLTPARERHDHLAGAFERQGVRVVEGDVRDQGLMLELVADQSLIFNLSGQSGAVRSMEDPWSDLDVNCRGTLTLLESMRAKNPQAKVVFAGSRLQYGKPSVMPVAEDSPRDARSLHAIHKQTVEEYTGCTAASSASASPAPGSPTPTARGRSMAGRPTASSIGSSNLASPMSR